MKKLIFILLVLISSFAMAQKMNWTTYFPVSENIVGSMVTGDNSLKMRIAEYGKNVVLPHILFLSV